MKISVLGAGAWGTALAGHLSARHDTLLWTRDFTLTDRHKNLCIVLPPTLHYEKNLEVAILHSAKYGALCIIATPVSGLRMICNAMRSYGCIPENIVWVCKGFEDKTQILPHQIVTDELPEQQSKGVLSGPGFAFEVAKNLPVELMIASKSTACQQHTIDAFHYGMMRIYASNDVVGVEIGGAVKNVLAIAIGIADGLNLGLSIRAALITRGLAEMSSLGVMLGGRLETFTGLTGLGDLILTATSDISRNRTVGLQLAEGRALEDILRNLGHVAEGVRCAQTVLEIAHEQSVDMPIINAVCSVLFNGVRPIDAIHKLLFQKIYV